LSCYGFSLDSGGGFRGTAGLTLALPVETAFGNSTYIAFFFFSVFLFLEDRCTVEIMLASDVCLTNVPFLLLLRSVCVPCFYWSCLGFRGIAMLDE